MPVSLEQPVASFPVLEVRNGAAPRLHGNSDYPVVGFVLRDQEIEVPDDTTDIHQRHTDLAGVLLVAAGYIPAFQVVPERDRVAFSAYSEPHMDGLVGTYYQAHTTHASGEGERSHMQLEAYNLDQKEHEVLQGFLEKGFGSTGEHHIYMSAAYGNQRRLVCLQRALGDRLPDAVWEHTAAPDATIVFPNGYDARAGTNPGVLYVHTFYIQPPDMDERIISLSRIEPIPPVQGGL